MTATRTPLPRARVVLLGQRFGAVLEVGEGSFHCLARPAPRVSIVFTEPTRDRSEAPATYHRLPAPGASKTTLSRERGLGSRSRPCAACRVCASAGGGRWCGGCCSDGLGAGGSAITLDRGVRGLTPREAVPPEPGPAPQQKDPFFHQPLPRSAAGAAHLGTAPSVLEETGQRIAGFRQLDGVAAEGQGTARELAADRQENVPDLALGRASPSNTTRTPWPGRRRPSPRES